MRGDAWESWTGKLGGCWQSGFGLAGGAGLGTARVCCTVRLGAGDGARSRKTQNRSRALGVALGCGHFFAAAPAGLACGFAGSGGPHSVATKISSVARLGTQ